MQKNCLKVRPVFKKFFKIFRTLRGRTRNGRRSSPSGFFFVFSFLFISFSFRVRSQQDTRKRHCDIYIIVYKRSLARVSIFKNVPLKKISFSSFSCALLQISY